MPFPYPTQVATARNRRTKEKDGGHQSSHRTDEGSRRPREQSASTFKDTRSMSSNSSTPQPALYAQQNVTIDQVPLLLASFSGSPSARHSPDLRISQTSINSGGMAYLPCDLRTPAALQQYLDYELDDSRAENLGNPSPSEAGPLSTIQTEGLGPQSVPREENNSSATRCNSPTRKNRTTLPVDSFISATRASSPIPPSFISRAFTPPAPPSTTRAKSIPIAGSPVPTESGLHGQYVHYPGVQYYTPLRHDFYPSDHAYDHGQHQPPQYYVDHNNVRPSSMLVAQDYNAIQTYTDLQRTASHRPHPNDESSELLYRIQQAIPDLHLLLRRCEQATDQFNAGDPMILSLEAQQLEVVKQREARIDDITKEAHNAAQRHSAENDGLRMEIVNLRKTNGELQEALNESGKSRDMLQARIRNLELDAKNIKQKAAEDQEALARDSTLAKDQATKDFEARMKNLTEELHHIRTTEASLQAKLSQMDADRLHDKEAAEWLWESEKKDLTSNHNKQRQELEVALQERTQKVADLEEKEAQHRKAWAREREDILQDWEDERARLRKESERRSRSLTKHHEKDKEETKRALQLNHGDQIKQLETENAKLRKDLKRARKDWSADKDRFSETTGRMKAAAGKLYVEHSNLQKLIEALGDNPDN